MNKSTKILFYINRIFLTCCFMYLCYLVYDINYKSPELFGNSFSDYVIVEGEFHTIQRPGIGRTKPSKFTYLLNGKRFINDTYLEIPCRDSDMDDPMKNKEILYYKFPVAVSKKDSSLALIMIRKEEFDKLNLDYPDSLQFMYNKYFNCSWWEEINQDD